MATLETLDTRGARRLALCRAGLLKPEWTGLPRGASGRGSRAREAALAPSSGASATCSSTPSPSPAPAATPSCCCRGWRASTRRWPRSCCSPAQPLFEYWGHEASWIPLELYPAVRLPPPRVSQPPLVGRPDRRAPRVAQAAPAAHPRRGPAALGGHGGARQPRAGGTSSSPSRWPRRCGPRGELAIRERRSFQRSYDLAERVIPASGSTRSATTAEALRARCCCGRSPATAGPPTGTLAQTWRLRRPASRDRGGPAPARSPGRDRGLRPARSTDGRETAGVDPPR